MPKKFNKPPQTNVKRIGEQTAKKMKSKLDQLKRKDEEIKSDSDDEPHKETMLVGLPDEEMVQETAEEKRLKMTK